MAFSVAVIVSRPLSEAPLATRLSIRPDQVLRPMPLRSEKSASASS
jgi:hypothetical protein